MRSEKELLMAKLKGIPIFCFGRKYSAHFLMTNIAIIYTTKHIVDLNVPGEQIAAIIYRHLKGHYVIYIDGSKYIKLDNEKDVDDKLFEAEKSYVPKV